MERRSGSLAKVDWNVPCGPVPSAMPPEVMMSKCDGGGGGCLEEPSELNYVLELE